MSPPPLCTFMSTRNSASWTEPSGFRDLLKKASTLGMEAVAITDHGNLFGCCAAFQPGSQERDQTGPGL